MTILQSRVNWVLEQAKARLGNPYVYGGVYSPYDVSQGADCSGVAGWILEALTKGSEAMSWSHNVSTESWYYDYAEDQPAAPGTIGPYGTIAVARVEDIPADAALTISLMHHGGGEDSHVSCTVPLPGSLPYEGVIIESNGGPTDYPAGDGSCTNGTGAYPATASLWTDWFYLPGPWVFDVPPGTDSPAPPAPVGRTYTVQSGDTMDAIAERFGVTVETLEAVNPEIPNPGLIYPGDVVKIP